MPRACLQHMCGAMPPTCAGALGRAAQDAGVAELLASLGARGQLRAEVAAALQALVAGARGAHAAGGVAGACARAWQWRSRGTGGHWSAGLSNRCQETWCTARFPLSARRGADAPLTSAVSGSELGHEGGGQVHCGDVGRVDRQCPARVGAGRRPGLGRRAGVSDVVWSRVGWSGGSHLVEGRPGRGTCGSLPSPQRRAVSLQAGRRSLPRRAPGRRSRPQRVHNFRSGGSTAPHGPCFVLDTCAQMTHPATMAIRPRKRAVRMVLGRGRPCRSRLAVATNPCGHTRAELRVCGLRHERAEGAYPDGSMRRA